MDHVHEYLIKLKLIANSTLNNYLKNMDDGRMMLCTTVYFCAFIQFDQDTVTDIKWEKTTTEQMSQCLPESRNHKFTKDGAPGKDAELLRNWTLRSRALVNDRTVDDISRCLFPGKHPRLSE